jgi:hypothetical protein
VSELPPLSIWINVVSPSDSFWGGQWAQAFCLLSEGWVPAPMQVDRLEQCTIKLEGCSEFEASDVILDGSQHFVVCHLLWQHKS